MLACLIADRETPPKNKGLKAKRRAIKALFGFLGKADDVALITADDMQRFKEHLVNTRGDAYARKLFEGRLRAVPGCGRR